ALDGLVRAVLRSALEQRHARQAGEGSVPAPTSLLPPAAPNQAGPPSSTHGHRVTQHRREPEYADASAAGRSGSRRQARNQVARALQSLGRPSSHPSSPSPAWLQRHASPARPRPGHFAQTHPPSRRLAGPRLTVQECPGCPPAHTECSFGCVSCPASTTTPAGLPLARSSVNAAYRSTSTFMASPSQPTVAVSNDDPLRAPGCGRSLADGPAAGHAAHLARGVA